ncbi:MAG: hypothetical protein Q7R52_03705 [archaeon]|nr:hypothetical protein [archaeon]
MKEGLILLILLVLIVFGYVFYSIGFKQGEHSFKENGLIINEKNNTYYEHFDNYYGIDYRNEGDKIVFEIKNPCIKIEKVEGTSRFPYWENESLIIIDTCFPPEKLEIGDVVLYYFDWDMTTKVHHRISDINYEKGWIKTKGDNLEKEDFFIGFERIYGKEVGYLNILGDKKVIKELYGATNKSITCLCSSKSVLKICGSDKDLLMSDEFVITNNLNEENCNSSKDSK